MNTAISADSALNAAEEAGDQASSRKIDLAMAAINAAMGAHAKYFTIEKSEVLVDDEFNFSMTVGFTPCQMELEDSRVIGTQQILQFDVSEEDEVCVISGEDIEQSVTLATIYSHLYWGEAIGAA